MDLIARLLVGTLAGFHRKEELIAVVGHPGPDAQLRVAIAGSGVDMIDTIRQQQLQGAVGVVLGQVAQRKRPKYRAEERTRTM